MAERRALFERRNAPPQRGKVFSEVFRRVAGVERAGTLRTERRAAADRRFRNSQPFEGRSGGDCVGVSGKCGLLRQGRLPVLVAGCVGQPLSARLAGSCARSQEKHCSVALKSRCLPCCVLRAKSSADFGGVGGETPERTGEGERTAEERAHGGRPACAAPQHQRILREECFVKTSQRSLTAMPSSRSSSTSFCASAGTASRHTGESPSSMVL